MTDYPHDADHSTPAPDGSDEALNPYATPDDDLVDWFHERCWDYDPGADWGTPEQDGHFHNPIKGIRAIMAAALASSSAAVDVPEWVDRVEILHEDDGNWVCSLGKWREAPSVYGAGPTIATAIANASKEGA